MLEEWRHGAHLSRVAICYLPLWISRGQASPPKVISIGYTRDKQTHPLPTPSLLHEVSSLGLARLHGVLVSGFGARVLLHFSSGWVEMGISLCLPRL